MRHRTFVIDADTDVMVSAANLGDTPQESLSNQGYDDAVASEWTADGPTLRQAIRGRSFDFHANAYADGYDQGLRDRFNTANFDAIIDSLEGTLA